METWCNNDIRTFTYFFLSQVSSKGGPHVSKETASWDFTITWGHSLAYIFGKIEKKDKKKYFVWKHVLFAVGFYFLFHSEEQLIVLFNKNFIVEKKHNISFWEANNVFVKPPNMVVQIRRELFSRKTMIVEMALFQCVMWIARNCNMQYQKFDCMQKPKMKI